MKVKKRSFCNISSAVLQYQKTGYTSAHSTLSSMQNVTVHSFRNTRLYRDILVLFRFMLSDHHTPRIIVQHMVERQEMPRDPMPAETVSCSWTHDPTSRSMACKYVRRHYLCGHVYH